MVQKGLMPLDANGLLPQTSAVRFLPTLKVFQRGRLCYRATSWLLTIAVA